MGEQVFSIVKSRIQAVIRQNRRDAIRARLGQYLLLILLTLFLVEEVKVILQPRTITIINNVQAKETIEIKQELTIEEKIKKAFPEHPDTMLAIAKAESRLNPKAHNENRNGTIDTGIFQINSIHGYSKEWLENPDNNIKAARAVYDKQGLTAWMTYQYAVEHNKPI